MVIHMTPDTLESIFGFHAAFGFLACAAMIALASALARVLRRSDGDEGERDD